MQVACPSEEEEEEEEEEEAREQPGPLTPDSGTFCPSDCGEAETAAINLHTKNKIKKSTSLQFPR